MAIRILHCIESIGSGGVEQRRLLLAQNLSKDLFTQHLICAKVKGNFDQRLSAFNTNVHIIGPLKYVFNIGYYFRLFKVIREVRPQIIHGAVFEGVISAVAGGLLYRIPIIIIEETSDPQNRSWRGNLLLRVLAYFADYVVGISPSVVNYLQEKVKINPVKIRLINNGVNVPNTSLVLSISKRIELGIQEQDFVVGSVGRLRDFHKRFSDLIKAASLLKNKLPVLKVVIVGGGDDSIMLENLAKELDVAASIVFVGYQKDATAYYSIMDVFALASHMEGFGLVVAEAMFFKLPVVATAVGGIKDIVVDGETGILVNRHSPQEIADAIVELYNNPEKRKRMGEKGFERATKEYSASAYTHRVESLYLEALKKKNISI